MMRRGSCLCGAVTFAVAGEMRPGDFVIICPIYAAGEKKNSKFNMIKFANLISKNSKTQIIIVNNEIELCKYIKKNLISNEIVIGMGAGVISKWMMGLRSSLL